MANAAAAVDPEQLLSDLQQLIDDTRRLTPAASTEPAPDPRSQPEQWVEWAGASIADETLRAAGECLTDAGAAAGIFNLANLKGLVRTVAGAAARVKWMFDPVLTERERQARILAYALKEELPGAREAAESLGFTVAGSRPPVVRDDRARISEQWRESVAAKRIDDVLVTGYPALSSGTHLDRNGRRDSEVRSVPHAIAVVTDGVRAMLYAIGEYSAHIAKRSPSRAVDNGALYAAFERSLAIDDAASEHAGIEPVSHSVPRRSVPRYAPVRGAATSASYDGDLRVRLECSLAVSSVREELERLLDAGPMATRRRPPARTATRSLG